MARCASPHPPLIRGEADESGVRLQISAFDPSRTLDPRLISERFRIAPRTWPLFKCRVTVRQADFGGEAGHEATRVHHAPRRGSGLAACCTWAVVIDGDWVPWQSIG